MEHTNTAIAAASSMSDVLTYVVMFVVVAVVAIVAAIAHCLGSRKPAAEQCDEDSEYDCIDGTKRSFPPAEEERQRAIELAQWQWML